MLYFISGQDEQKSLAYFNKTIEQLKAKRPDVSYFRFDAENFNQDVFTETIFGRTMFADKYLVSCNNIFSKKEFKDFFLENIKQLADSPNLFVCRENEVDQDELKKIKSVAYNTRIFEAGETKEDRTFYLLFKITDAFGQKDIQTAWLSLQKALLAGLSHEEVFWKLIWQIKNMILAKKIENKEISGQEVDMKPNVLAKSRSFARNFSSGELSDLHERLIDIYASSRSGATDMDVSIEQFILSK